MTGAATTNHLKLGESERPIDEAIEHDLFGQALEYTEQRPLPPTVFIIFGANGDLTKRKLIPALYNLASSRHLPEQFHIIGVDCVPMSTREFRDKIHQDLHELTARPIDLSLIHI